MESVQWNVTDMRERETRLLISYDYMNHALPSDLILHMGLLNYFVVGRIQILHISGNTIRSEFAVCSSKASDCELDTCNENILTLCDCIWDENFYYIPGSHSCFHRNYIRMDSLSMHMRGYIHNVSGITMQHYIYEILNNLQCCS
jgi:hypothetical protein